MQTKKIKGSSNLNIKNSCYQSFLKDISKYQIISSEDEVNLFNRYKKGDELAFSKIIESNLRFVVFIAKSICKNKEILLDVINQGNIGLIIAIDKFDVTKGVKFITFAVHYIQREIINYIALTEPLVRQTNINKTFHVQSKIENKFYIEEGRYPTEDEVMDIINEKYGYDIKQKSDLYNLNITSLDNSFLSNSDEVNDDKMINIISSDTINSYEDTIENEYTKNYIRKITNKLSKRDKLIIELIYGINNERSHEFKEVADILNLTYERVRQIHNSTIKILRESCE